MNVARGCRDGKQAAPDAQAGQRVINFGLREQSLGFRHILYVSQTGFVTGRCLLNSGAGGRNLNRSAVCNCARATNRGDGGIPLGLQIGGDLLSAGFPGAEFGLPHRFARLNGWAIEDGKGDGESDGVVLRGGSEAVEVSREPAVRFRAGAACIGGTL